jgi:Ca2+-binding EF-hand superfamily protein
MNRRSVQSRFDLFDANHDGVLSLRENQAGETSLGKEETP